MELRQSQPDNSSTSKTSKLGRTKKRKIRLENNAAESEKSACCTWGSLKKLVEMPMDVLFEIFGKLEPLDLLHIARTTKALYAVLMSRSSVSVWRAARSNVVGLPDCPDDLNEPQYATLVFVPRCSFCQRKISYVHIFWYARVRCCNKCVEFNFIRMKGRHSLDQNCPNPALLADWIPSVKIIPEKGMPYDRENTEAFYISQRIWDKWEHEYSAIKDPKSQHEWLLRTATTCHVRQKHALACAIWHKIWSKSADVDTLRQILGRNREIMDYIREIGFEEELYKLPPVMPNPLDELEIQPLWDPLGPSIKDSPAFMKKLKDLLTTILSKSELHREHLEYRAFFSSRKRFISGIYNDGIAKLPLNSPYPTLAQFYHITDDLNLIDYSTTVGNALRVPFDEFMDVWRKHVDRKLISRIVEACGSEYTFDPTTVLDLATTFFYCVVRFCGRSSLMRHDQAMVHFCTERSTYNSTPSEKEFNSLFGSALWCESDAGQSTQFSPDNLKMAQKIVEMCGLDPKVTTTRQMDELHPVFECRRCSSFEEGRITMTWVAALQHQRLSHASSPQIDALRILGEPEATKVRERIKEEQVQRDYQWRGSRVLCPHCRSEIANLPMYRDHLKQEHKISKVKYEEVIFSFRRRQIPPEYRLWPPLDEESGDEA